MRKIAHKPKGMYVMLLATDCVGYFIGAFHRGRRERELYYLNIEAKARSMS